MPLEARRDGKQHQEKRRSPVNMSIGSLFAGIPQVASNLDSNGPA